MADNAQGPNWPQDAGASTYSAPAPSNPYLEKLKSYADPAAYQKLMDVLQYGGQSDIGAQIFTPLSPEVLQNVPKTVQPAFDWSEGGDATPTSQSLPVGTSNGIPVYANYDERGNLSGFSGDQTYRAWVNGNQSYGGQWDASGNAAPRQYTSRGGGFFGGLASDLASSFGGYGPLLANLALPGAGTAISLANAALNNGDLSGALKNLAISQAVGRSGLGDIVSDATDSALAGRLASSTVSGLATGQPIENALINAGIGAASNEASNAIRNATTPDITPVPPVNSGGDSVMGGDIGMSPEDAANTDWASIYEQPSVPDDSDQTPLLPDPSNPNLEPGPTPEQRQLDELERSQNAGPLPSQDQYPAQDFGVTPDVNIPLYSPGSTGFSSGWQTVGSDRIMVQDDGTAIGINTETNESYSLTPEQVTRMVDYGLLNSNSSGYTAATTGTSDGVKVPASAIKAILDSTVGTNSGSGGNATTQKTSPLSLGQDFLNGTPQMLAGAPVYGSKQAQAPDSQLKQIYDTLTPELKSVFAQRGIQPNYTYGQQQPEVQPVAQDNYDYTKPPQFVASGGSIIDEAINPKFAPLSKTMLEGAPVIEHQSRMGALRHLGQGISGGRRMSTQGFSHGGLPHKYAQAAPAGHNPEFITGVTGYYASGKGTGQSDDIPAMLHDGDYVADADLVAALGDGSSKAGAEALEKFRRSVPHQEHAEGGHAVPAKIADGEYVFPASFVTAIGKGDNKAGAKILDRMREEIREHKRSAPTNKIPPKAKSPLDYLKMAKG